MILQLGWGPPSDMWSVACIIMELYIGELLFPTVSYTPVAGDVERAGGGGRAWS